MEIGRLCPSMIRRWTTVDQCHFVLRISLLNKPTINQPWLKSPSKISIGLFSLFSGYNLPKRWLLKRGTLSLFCDFRFFSYNFIIHAVILFLGLETKQRSDLNKEIFSRNIDKLDETAVILLCDPIDTVDTFFCPCVYICLCTCERGLNIVQLESKMFRETLAQIKTTFNNKNRSRHQLLW